MRSLVLCLAVLWLVLPAAAQDSEPSPELLRFQPVAGTDSILFAGATPDQEVVVLGVARQQVGFLPTTTRYERRAVADGEGSVEILLGEPLPQWSVWTAVDLATGRIAAAAPEGTPVRQIEHPARGLGAAQHFIEDERQRLELLVVRPAVGAGDQPNDPAEVGAWGLSVGDGGASDRDGDTDGAMRLSLLDLRPVGDSPPSPEQLAPGDVVLGVDGEDLSYYAVRLAAPADGEGGQGGEGE